MGHNLRQTTPIYPPPHLHGLDDALHQLGRRRPRTPLLGLRVRRDRRDRSGRSNLGLLLLLRLLLNGRLGHGFGGRLGVGRHSHSLRRLRRLLLRLLLLGLNYGHLRIRLGRCVGLRLGLGLGLGLRIRLGLVLGLDRLGPGLKGCLLLRLRGRERIVGRRGRRRRPRSDDAVCERVECGSRDAHAMPTAAESIDGLTD